MVEKKKPQTSKYEIAYNYIKTAILKNELKPDTLVPEREICDHFGFSKTPIREALRRLASEGLVDFVPDKGTFVSRISLNDLIEIYEIRESLEGIAASICALRKDEETIKALYTVKQNTIDNFMQGDNRQAMQNDMEFHSIIIRGANNKKLEAILKTIYDQISRVANTAIDDKEILNISLEYHKQILDAIANGDSSKAEAMIRKHIEESKQYHIRKHYIY